MSYDHYSPAERYYLRDIPPKDYAVAALRRGDRVRISANPLPTRILLGSLETDPVSLSLSKRLLLEAFPSQTGMVWSLRDAQSPGVRIGLQPGQVYPIGRTEPYLFRPDERDHPNYELSIKVEGDVAEITRLDPSFLENSNYCGCFVMAPDRELHLLPVRSDES